MELRQERSQDGRLYVQAEAGPPGEQQQATAQPGGATSGQQSSVQQSNKQGASAASHASE